MSSEAKRGSPIDAGHAAGVQRLLAHGLREFELGHVDAAVALWEAAQGFEPGNERAAKYISYARNGVGESPLLNPSSDDAEAVEELVVDESSIEIAMGPLRHKMRELFALGNFTDSLVVANNILSSLPDDVEARGTRHRAADALEKILLSKVAALDEAIEVRLTPEEHVWLNLNPSESQIFARINGRATVGQLLSDDIDRRLEALRFLVRLAEEGAIGVPGKQFIRTR